MGAGKRLSEFEKGQIVALKGQGKSNREIGRLLLRSHKVIDSFLKLGDNYGAKKSTGRPRSISPRTQRQLIRGLVVDQSSTRNLKNDLKLTCNQSTIWRSISRTGLVQNSKAEKKPVLSAKHKLCRLNFAKSHITFGNKQYEVIFTDEKSLCLDGPHGLHNYWRYKTGLKQVATQRQTRGGGLMLWAGVSSNGKTDLCFIKGNIDSKGYTNNLDAYLLPVAELIAGSNWILLQDNATIHTQKWTRQWLSENNIKTIDWPARSPDLNIIENIWGWLAIKLQGKQGRVN